MKECEKMAQDDIGLAILAIAKKIVDSYGSLRRDDLKTLCKRPSQSHNRDLSP